MRPLSAAIAERRVLLAGAILLAYNVVPALAQCPDGAPPPCRGAVRTGAAPTSVAVLYFDNASADSADAYLADGITEEIISRLGEVGRLQVKSRYLVQRFRGARPVDPQAIGRQLAVASIVTGSVRRAGNRLHVTAEMLRSSTGDIVWSQRFDRAETDVLALQEDLAGAVASAVAGRLLPEERQALAALPTGGTRNPAANNLYLLGRFYWSKRTAPDLVRAAGYFQQAIALDSIYAQAWSGLADAYVLFQPAEYDVPGINPDSILTLAERAARRAVALAPGLGEAYTSLGEILEYRWRWEEARAAFERGAALSPDYPTAHLWYGYDLAIWNRFDDAVREMRRAKELDPYSMLNTLSLGAVLDGVGRFDEADAMVDEARAMAPSHAVLLAFASAHDLFRGNFPRLALDFRDLLVSHGDSAGAAAMERRIRDPASRAAALRESARTDSSVVWRALVYQALDSDTTVIRYLGSLAGGSRRAEIGALLYCGCLKTTLRNDPRMQATLAQLGFPATR